jgi:chromosome segregation protein
MRVTRLEVFGFKSFMDRLVLPLNSGISGVVGPNGCGKSNIVDALRWVLGETRAKNLRGAIAEDVIFNGTEKLRPLGLAEVSITVASENKNFFEDVISPGLEADNVIDSVEFADEAAAGINAEEAAKPATELSSEERSVGHLKVIDGGALESNLANNQGAGNNSAGTNSADTNSTDTAQGVDATAQDLASKIEVEGSANAATLASKRASSLVDKFAWLRSASEVQITRRLYRSGESEYFINRVPCRLKDIVDIFRAVGMGARTYNIVAQGEISRIVTLKPEDKRAIIEEAAGVLGFRDRIASTNRRLKETELNIARVTDIVKEVERNVGSLKRQAAKAKNRESLKARVVELEDSLFKDKVGRLYSEQESLARLLAEVKEQQGSLQEAVTQVLTEEGEARNKLMGIDIEADAIRSRIDAIREDLNNRERQLQAKKSRLQEMVVLEQAAGTEVKRLKERETTLSERRTACQENIKSFKSSEGDISNQISGLESGSHDDLKLASEKLQQAREALRASEGELRNIREKLVADESRLGALNEQLKAASPASKLKETLGEEGREYLNRAVGLLVDGIKVPNQYAAAIQAVLAEKTTFLVSNDVDGLSKSFVQSVLKNERNNNKKGQALGIFKVGSAPAYRVASLKSELIEGVRSALDIVEVKPEYSLATSNILAEVYCADSVELAQAFIEKIKDKELATEPVIVTLTGDIYSRYGFYSLRHEGGLVQLKNRIVELETSVASYKTRQGELTTIKEQRQSDVSKSEQHHTQVLRESQERARLVKELSQKLGSARGRLHAEERLLEQLGKDIERTGEQTQDTLNRIEKLKQDQEAMKAQISDEVTDEEKAMRVELDELTQKSQGVEAVRREGRQMLMAVTDRLNKARSELDSCRSTESKTTLNLQKVQLEVGHSKEMALEHLAPEIVDAVMKLSASELEERRLADGVQAEFRDEVQKLKSRIMREGDVDPSSIERCDEECKRLEDLEKQRVDLQSAHVTLTKTVEKLIEISQQRFIETFTAVNKNFSELAPKIFGGGSAHLELTDPANPLESGVEIAARPPGKKLKSIELLSGGEKTLCAISLIMAMFLERPSPICVLDEVDAPLDEANVVRFLSLIKEMSSTTQFVLITHNKQTMSVCDQLVGVTMEQPGASKIVTVSLQEAYSHATTDSSASAPA